MAVWKPIALIGGLAVLGLGGYAVLGPDIDITVSEAQANLRLQDSLPLTYAKDRVTAVVEKASVDFQSDNRARVTANVDIQGYGFSGVAFADAASGIRYEDGDFYLVDVTLDEVDFRLDDESSQRVADVRAVATSIWNMAKDKAVEHLPEAGDAIERLKGDAVAGLSAKTRGMIEDALRTTPVYSLNGKGLKETFAVMALEDVQFTREAVVIRLDPGRAVLKLLGFLALGVGGVLGAAVMMLPLLGGRR
jgi:hypothetical protein